MRTEPDAFVQDGPRLRDEWTEDDALWRMLGRLLPPDVAATVTPGLAAMGSRAATDLRLLADSLDVRAAEPRHVPYDAWGRRVDRIETAPAWDRLLAEGKAAGVVAAGYEPTHGPWRRLHQFALAYLFAPSSGLVSCPFAMTDGAAATLLAHGDRDVVDEVVPRLTSRDPDRAWTSGQWMTERTGGSDVGRSRTRAVRDGDHWRLTGVKWFTSAITADVALALARPADNPPGGAGLAMFLVRVRDDDGAVADGIRVLRLKDKLGTRQLPTAELALDGARARLVGAPSGGTRAITPMLGLTRLWNAVTAAAGMRRAFALARDYAERRVVFGRRLIEQPLHVATLAAMRAEYEGALVMVLRAATLLGRIEDGDRRDERLLRMLLPLTKLTTAKQAVAVASEALEAFGGAGYVEDTHLPVLLRDAQVLPIWEGTTNVLALDALRAWRRDGALEAVVADVGRAAGATRHPPIAAAARVAVDATAHAVAWLDEAADRGEDVVQHGARRWALTLGRAVQVALLAEQAQHDLDRGDRRGVAVLRRHARTPVDLLEPPGQALVADGLLVADRDGTGSTSAAS